MNEVLTADQTGKADNLRKKAESTIQNSLKYLGVKKAEVSVMLVNDKQIQNLNKRYRGIDRPTDVLSFPQNLKTASQHQLLGDIVISIPTMRRQAKKAGHSVEFEFDMLTIHGLLHLLGYDHRSKRDARKMFRLQNQLLAGKRIE